MNNFDAFFLGFIQGLTEFLPISSTGHLILVEKFLHISSSLSFDVFIHLGSFLAILIYFRKDFKKIWDYKWFIVISAIPGSVAGLIFEPLVETYLRTPSSVAFFLIFMSIPLILGEILGKKKFGIKDLNYKKAIFIGVFQALAIMPGTSRSGITISAGLLMGLKRNVSAEFSFLSGAFLILGAGIYEGLKLIKHPSIQLDTALIGFLSSTIFSFLAIIFLISFLKRHSLYVFAIYRIILGIIIFVNLK